MTTVISVENISKKYIIKHQKQGSYLTLRDTIMENISRFGKRIFQGQQIDDTKEEFWALKDVSFEIKQGDRIGIIGRNGAGKSTLLKILSRITEPTSGRIRIKGRVASLLEVGTGFHPELTGRENIYLNGAILGMSKNEIKKKFDEIVEFAEVEKFLDTPVKRYSSGMYVRLAFAVAAHLESEILILDEVLAVGDSQFQKKCFNKINSISKEGRTIILVSHNMALVKNMCNSALLFSNGKLSFKGNIIEVIGKYMQSYNKKENVCNKGYIARNENFDITLSDINLINVNGQEIIALEVGTQASIKLKFNTKKRFDNLLVSIGIETIDEVRTCLLHSVISGNELQIKPPVTEITCHIPKVNLFPDKYKISIKVMSNNNLLFWLPFVTEIEVEKGDFYGTGKLPEKEWGGYFLMENYWSCI